MLDGKKIEPRRQQDTGEKEIKKKLYIALNMHRGECEMGSIRTKVALPPGCSGLFFGFNTKKAAREFWNKDVRLLEVIIEEKKK